MVKRQTPEEFLELAKCKFLDQFDYELSEFKNSNSKIKVYCKRTDHFGEAHGWFETTPYVHLRGNGGCKLCQYSKGYLCRDKKDFIFWATKIHGDAYDYSDFEYVDAKTKGLIKCKVDLHGPFYMHPNNHLSRKAGCPKCGSKEGGKKQSITKSGGLSVYERLVNEGSKIHKNKFDYSLINPDQELKTRDFVTVICPNHGKINIQISVHLNGHDCRLCGLERSADLRRKDQDRFIQECKRKWNQPDEYYSLVEYIGKAHPITLLCPIHGSFQCSSAGSHLQRGDGCPICSGNAKKTRDEIIQLCINKHGLTYDYSSVEKEIFSVHDKISITCQKHGIFLQNAIGHYLMGYGCPRCGLLKSGLDNIKSFLHDEKRAQSYCELYLVSVGDFWKIGIAEDTYKRDPKYYDDYILVLPSKRAVCWVVEQRLLEQTSWLEPTLLPKELTNWPGRSELRRKDIDVDDLILEMESLIETAENIGWYDFAVKYQLASHGYGWDPDSAL